MSETLTICGENWIRKEAHDREVDRLTKERDDAIREANRRDQKWMDGINESVGRKLDYGDPCSRDNASSALAKFVAALTKEKGQAVAACVQMRDAIEWAIRAGDESVDRVLALSLSPDCGKGWRPPEEFAKLEAKLHLQQRSEDAQPTLADFQQSQKDLIELGKKCDVIAKEKDEAVAACAVMRQMFFRVYEWELRDDSPDESEIGEVTSGQINELLESETCGQPLLDLLHEARALLNSREVIFRMPGAGSWSALRDKWNEAARKVGIQ